MKLLFDTFALWVGKCILALAMLIAAISLSGCAVISGTSSNSSEAVKQADLVFIGAPAPLSWFTAGLQGTAFKVADGYSLTASHVAYPLLKRVAGQSINCDATLIKSNSSSKTHKLAIASVGDSVSLYGYSAINSLPKESHGKITGWYKEGKCMMMIVSGAGGVSGMSGGPVVNQRGETVGIISAVELFGDGRVLIVPVQSFRNVLDSKHIPYSLR